MQSNVEWKVALEIWRVMTFQVQDAPTAVRFIDNGSRTSDGTQAAFILINERLRLRRNIFNQISCFNLTDIMAYHIPRSAFRYMDDATFRSGPSVSPAYGTSRSKDSRIPHSVYSPAQRGEYGRAGHNAYDMAYERGTPYESNLYPLGRGQRHLSGDMIQR